MSSKNRPTTINRGEGRHEKPEYLAGAGPGFSHEGYGHLPPTQDLPPNADEKYERLTRELVLISAGFLVMIALAWVMFSGAFTNKREVRIDTSKRLAMAQTHLQEDRLTYPPGDNAMAVYLAAKQQSLGSSTIDEGLNAISARYLEMVDDLTERGEFALAASTLDSAAQVIPHGPSSYAYALTEARERLEKARHEFAQARLSARSTAETYEPLSVFHDYLSNGTPGPEMVVIPEGTFVFGSPETEANRDPDEGPAHPLSIHQFAMAKTETTFAQYRLFVEAMGWAMPDDTKWGYGQQPVINISWVEATAYAAWLSKETGFRYRLPTEAEWEYAARAGTDTAFINGDCLTPEYANVDFRVRSPECPALPANEGKTEAVGTRLPNPWGLHNMYGNVREWVQDCWLAYDPTLTDGSARYTAEGGSCGASGQRVLRGGAWLSNTSSARTANRFAKPEHQWYHDAGLRLVRELDHSEANPR